MATVASSSIGGAVQHFGIAYVGLGFKSCSHDCVGAAVTDLLLAVHAGYTACRLLCRARRAQRAAPVKASTELSFASIAVGQILSNCGWSTLGAVYWLQPGGRRFWGFETAWRLSAQFQVTLFIFAYALGQRFNRMGAVSPFVSRHETLLSSLGVAHAVLFGLVCLSPTTCHQHEYVLWGGANIMLPLLSQWYAASCVAFGRGLHRNGWRVPGRYMPHPLLLAVISGGFFWLGNTVCTRAGLGDVSPPPCLHSVPSTHRAFNPSE